MNNIETTKLDLNRKIMGEMNLPKGIDSSYRRLVSYFLQLDLINTLGKTEFDVAADSLENDKAQVGEIEITRTRDGIYISTIFDSNYQVKFRNESGVDVYKIHKKEDGELDLENVDLAFSIKLRPNVVTNTIINKKGVIAPEFSQNEPFEVMSTYEVNIPDKTFTYACSENGKEVSYKACLSGLNAKFSSQEMLSYEREIPPVEQDVNIFKRIATFLDGTKKIEHGEGVISVSTSSFLTELTDYAESIFNILRREAVKVIKKENSKYGKYLRTINEEI